MSWKRIFPRDKLIEILLERDYVFVVDENLYFLVGRVKDINDWHENRIEMQRNLLGMIRVRPEIFEVIYKLLDFISKDRKSFKLKCCRGSDNAESMNWEFRHRQDKLMDFKATVKRQGIAAEELKRIIRLFFLAAPELFIEDCGDDGKRISIATPGYDNLYFLCRAQNELDEFYSGLKNGNSVVLDSWLALLS